MKDNIAEIETPIKKGRGRPRKIQPDSAPVRDEESETIKIKRIKLPELPVLTDKKRNKSLTIEFPLHSDFISSNEFIGEDGRKKPVKVFHLYPRLLDWPARSLPDSPNPRSHGQKILSSPVAKEIEETLRSRSEHFHFINRGLTILASEIKFGKGKATITVTGEDNGVADGATTDAVISKVQEELKQLAEIEPNKPSFLSPEGRVRVEVIEDMIDRDLLALIVEGRNRSNQVKAFSLANFAGRFDWLRDLIDANGSPFQGKIGWEENAPHPMDVIDVLALLTLFHRQFDGNEDSPVFAYSNKSKIIGRLSDEDTAKGYQALTPIVMEILKLHDYVYASFEAKYDEAFNGKTKLGRRIGFESRLLGDPHKLPLTGSGTNYKIERGIIFPLMNSFRALVRYSREGDAGWKQNPYSFFDNHGAELIKVLIRELDAAGTPNRLGKNPLSYIALNREAQLILSK